MDQENEKKESTNPVKYLWQEDSGRKAVQQIKQKLSLGQRWSAARPKKTIVFWSWVGIIIATVVVGFGWGGWVTGGNAQKMSATVAEDAVTQRLAPICVTQFSQDPGKDQKLIVLKETSSWMRGTYVESQGWATMPGESEPDSQVAKGCAKLLMGEEG